MAEIREFKPREGEFNEAVIRDLEHLLGMARRGDLIELVSAGVVRGGGIHTSCSGSNDIYRLIGAMEQIKTELLTDKIAECRR